MIPKRSTTVRSITKSASVFSAIPMPIAENAIPAGFPSVADDAKSSIDIAAYLVKRPESTYFIRVAGDSMTGAGIFDGDLLVVDRSLIPDHGDIVIAVVNNEFTVKRLYKNGSKIELRAENPRFRKLTLNAEIEFDIWGVVTNAIKSYH